MALTAVQMPHTERREAAQQAPSQQIGADRIFGFLLALLPVLSFCAQLIFSIRSGTKEILYHHLTVMVVDWVFIPFNYLVVRAVDWRNGPRLYAIFIVSVILNVVTFAYWQRYGLDPGHMITTAGVILPAGWVHLSFSTVEMVLILAFGLCRLKGSDTRIATFLASAYFLAIPVTGHLMHGSYILSDVIVFVSGLLLVLVVPRLARDRG